MDRKGLEGGYEDLLAGKIPWKMQKSCEENLKGLEFRHYGKNLTSGSVFKNIVFFSLPYLLSYFLQTLYGMADLFIIGQFEGVDSITAVSVGSQVMHMLTVMIVGLAMGSTVVIGKAVGAGKSRRLHQ